MAHTTWQHLVMLANKAGGSGGGMKRVPSVSDQCDQMDKLYRNQNYARVGAMCVFPTLAEFEACFDPVLERFPFASGLKVDHQHLPINILNVGLVDIVKGAVMSDDQIIAYLQPFITQNHQKVNRFIVL